MDVIQSKWFGPGRTVPISLIVIHDMEAPENSATAENVARYFSTLPASNKASAHVCVDNNSAVRCVADGDRAWHAPGANSQGLGIELAGYARQSSSEWLDAYSKGVLNQAAVVVAGWCTKHGIPAKRLSVAEVKAGKKGICGHVDVSKAFGQSNHSDPGPNFPWDYFIKLVNSKLHPVTSPPVAPKPAPSKPAVKPKPVYKAPAFPKGLKPNSSKPSAVALQRALKAAGYLSKSVAESPNYGIKTQTAVYLFLKAHPQYAAHGVVHDVAIGPKGWAALFNQAYGK